VMSGIKKVALLRAFLLVGAVNALQTWSITPSPGCSEDMDCEMSQGVCNNEYSNCNFCDYDGVCKPGCSTDANCQKESPCVACDGQHLCQYYGCPYVVEIIVKTENCSGCATGNKEEGLQLQLTGLLGLTECKTENLDNPDAQDYTSGSVAHFGKDGGLGGCWTDLNQAIESGSIAWTGSGTWVPESENPICVDFFGDDNLNYCCQLGQALTSADGFKPLSNCHPV